jgi:sugar lactone lactonase YvrE
MYALRSFRHIPIVVMALLVLGWLAMEPAQARAPQPNTDAVLSSFTENIVPMAKQSPVAGEPLPRIVCPEEFEAFVYAAGLESPGGLAFDENDVLYVAEEKGKQVTRIEPGGAKTTVATGLAEPEGIALDPAGNLYVVEDIENGRLLRIEPGGQQTVLATGLAAPEGVVWSPDEQLYITESNVQFIENIPWDVVSGVTRISPEGSVTKVLTDTLLWSYSAITRGGDGLLYVANEASNVGTTDSIFQIDPLTGIRTLFASDLTAPEGLHFSPGGYFPLYATEEDVGDGIGRLNLVQSTGAHQVLCTGFRRPEGVAVDSKGNLYVTDQDLIVQILAPDLVPPGPPQQVAAEPSGWTATNGFTLTWENPFDTSGIAGAYLKLGEPPAAANDGIYYPGEAITKVVDVLTTLPGAQLAYLWLEDGASNADHTSAAAVTLHYDPTPPGSPIGLSADPADWSPDNRFTLSWTNPPELSGVTKACYRLKETPPTASGSQDCQSGVGIQSLVDVTVPEGGEHTVFIWLEDAAGNTEPATAISHTLRYDAIPPVSTAQVPAVAQTAPIRVTWVASDTHSVVEKVSLWVKIGNEGAWSDSGLSFQPEGGIASSGTSQGFFLYQPSGQGTYFFAARASDQAGNAEAEPSGDGEAQTDCQTWQQVYVPVLLRDGL